MLGWLTDAVVNRYLYPGGESGDAALRYTWVDQKVPCMVYTRPDSRRLIVYVHGNAMTLGSLHESGLPEAISSTAMADVVTVEYPGYGVAPPCQGDMDDACCANVATVLSYARRHAPQRGADGTQPWLRGAAHDDHNPRLNNVVSHVVLLSGFNSVRDMCASGWQRIVRDQLVSKRNITTLAPTVGVSIVHGTKDEVVPYAHAKVLHAARRDSVLHPIVDMNHNPNQAEMTHIACLVQNITSRIHGELPRWSRDVPTAQPREQLQARGIGARLCPF